MYSKLTQTMKLPDWARPGSRWRKLMIYDKLLDGEFYDHLPFAFYDEQDHQGNAIPLERRRPSVQYRLPRYVARWVARKVFAGRHAPKIRTTDDADAVIVRKLVSQCHLWPKMFEAAYRGSVGSVAVTFRVADGKAGIKVWKAQLCSPVFDDFGELACLRVHYVTSGAALAVLGLTVDDPRRDYWFIRDYLPQSEITYAPPRLEDWNPVEGPHTLVPAKETLHGLPFVPGIWIANPGGTDGPDGCALWEDAIPNSIEIDYLLSQASRGARYNCAPQLVTQGQIQNVGEQGFIRGPTTYLAFDAARKDAQGEMLGGGDAHLLEMTGAGTKAALDTVEKLKKLALEQIGVMQKDPSEIPSPVSGRAMEFLDEDAHDVAMQWRTTYGDGGALPLLRKIMFALDMQVDPESVSLQYPRIYQPTPDDLVKLVTGLTMAVKPVEVQTGTDADGKPVMQVLPALMDPATAQGYLVSNMDLGIDDEFTMETGPGPAKSHPEPEE